MSTQETYNFAGPCGLKRQLDANQATCVNFACPAAIVLTSSPRSSPATSGSVINKIPCHPALSSSCSLAYTLALTFLLSIVISGNRNKCSRFTVKLFGRAEHYGEQHDFGIGGLAVIQASKQLSFIAEILTSFWPTSTLLVIVIAVLDAILERMPLLFSGFVTFVPSQARVAILYRAVYSTSGPQFKLAHMPRATKNAFQVRLHMGDSVQNRAERDNVGEAGCQVDVGQKESRNFANKIPASRGPD
ncbi:hypothetical protein R3P38DRAFT_3353956 [Favolaschia claudopus]|uniref:Uncharacterized protein n=1 Tax=Favolaschia claudopus TaxID=2862362 RepID=A0AAW0BQZ5_9AGAR